LGEEHLMLNIRERDRGTVRIHKGVEVTPVHETVEVRRDEVLIEQRQVDRPATTVREPWYEGETLVVPIYEEILVTEKRLMLREELRITRQSVVKQVKIDDSVRRDVVSFERIEPANESERESGPSQ
jgi:uncharacterized protein (TIGR02271 family)